MDHNSLQDCISGTNDWVNIQLVLRSAFHSLAEEVAALRGRVLEGEDTLEQRLASLQANSEAQTADTQHQFSSSLSEVASCIEELRSSRSADAALRTLEDRLDAVSLDFQRLRQQLSQMDVRLHEKGDLAAVRGLMESLSDKTRLLCDRNAEEVESLRSHFSPLLSEVSAKLEIIRKEQHRLSAQTDRNTKDLEEVKTALSDVRGLLDKKMTAVDVETLVAAKADMPAVSSFVNDQLRAVYSTLDLKASSADVASLKRQLGEILRENHQLAGKVDLEALREMLSNDLQVAVDRIHSEYVTRERYQQRMDSLSSSLSAKAEKTEFEKLRTIFKEEMDQIAKAKLDAALGDRILHELTTKLGRDEADELIHSNLDSLLKGYQSLHQGIRDLQLSRHRSDRQLR